MNDRVSTAAHEHSMVVSDYQVGLFHYAKPKGEDHFHDVPRGRI